MENKPKRNKVVWITVTLAVAMIAVGIFITREPALPYGFLNKYQVSERRTSEDGKLKILVLKGSVEEVWNDIQREFGSKRRFNSTGITNVNGVVTEYRSIGTEEGLIKVSNDLSFANEGFGVEIMQQNVRPGYCAIAFTRPKTIFDRAMEWMTKTFRGSSKPSPPPQESTTIHV